MKISNEVKRFGGRDIIYVELEDKRQPFYRSTGKNSGMPNTWLPFDGIGYLYNLWFDKTAYCRPYSLIERFGTDELFDISAKLGAMDIKKGKVCDPEEINEWLGTESSLLWNQSLNNYWPNFRKEERFETYMTL